MNSEPIENKIPELDQTSTSSPQTSLIDYLVALCHHVGVSDKHFSFEVSESCRQAKMVTFGNRMTKEQRKTLNITLSKLGFTKEVTDSDWGELSCQWNGMKEMRGDEYAVCVYIHNYAKHSQRD